MNVVRRWYLVLVCLISLQSITWATISLLRELVTDAELVVDGIAFQAAVLIVGLPLFLAHWLWMQRLAAAEPAERGSALRYAYLYVTLALLLLPLVNNLYFLLVEVIGPVLRENTPPTLFSPREALKNLCAIGVLGLLAFYHQRVVGQAGGQAHSPSAALARRVYLYTLSGAGLTLLLTGAASLLRWLLWQLGSSPSTIETGSPVTSAISLVLIGVPLWFAFWVQAQALFARNEPDEQEAALRKLYLYGAVFVTAAITVLNGSLILAGLLRRLLSLPASGDIRDPLSIILILLVPWLYHSRVLNQDAQTLAEVPRQAQIRRLYLYLVGAIGLFALLLGLTGLIGALLQLRSEGLTDGLREQIALAAASLLTGLPVWLLPWRRVQVAALRPAPEGSAERRSLARKLYLYLFLLLATLNALGGAVFVVYQLLTVALGERTSERLLDDLAQAIAFILIAVGVWLYHGYVLREDGRLGQAEESQRFGAQRVAVVDGGNGQWGQALLARLRQELPSLILAPVALTAEAAQAMGSTEGSPLPLPEATLLVGPWTVATPSNVLEGATAEVAQAIAESPARKLLIPVAASGWAWVGVEPVGEERLMEATVQAVRQVLTGEGTQPERSLSPAIVISVVVGLLVLLCGVISLLTILGPF